MKRKPQDLIINDDNTILGTNHGISKVAKQSIFISTHYTYESEETVKGMGENNAQDPRAIGEGDIKSGSIKITSRAYVQSDAEKITLK